MKKVVCAVSLVATFLLVAGSALAGTDGAEFVPLYTLIQGWTQGTLGKTLSVATFLVGMGFSVVQQSLVPVAVGIGSAASLSYAPDVISGLFTAMI